MESHNDVSQSQDAVAGAVATITNIQIGRLILALPTLSRSQVPVDDYCGICLQPFSTILEATGNPHQDVCEFNGEVVHLHGVTRLDECGHIFCREDLIEWIRGFHGTCPTCRHQFLDISSPPDSDEESIDEDYVPPDEDEFFDSDGFTDPDADDFEFEPDDMILDDEDLASGFSPVFWDTWNPDQPGRFLDGGELGVESQADHQNLQLGNTHGSGSMHEEEVHAALGTDKPPAQVPEGVVPNPCSGNGGGIPPSSEAKDIPGCAPP